MKKYFYLLVLLGLQSSFALASAEPSKASKNIDAITEAAEKICGSIPLSGNTEDTEVKLGIKAAVAGMLKRIAGINGEVEAAYEKKESLYEGIAQNQLPEALKDQRGCKMKMAEVFVQYVGEAKWPNTNLDGISIEGFDNGIKMQPYDDLNARDVKIKGTGREGGTGIDKTGK